MKYYVETTRGHEGTRYDIMCVGDGKVAQTSRADYAYKIVDWLNDCASGVGVRPWASPYQGRHGSAETSSNE